MNTKFNKRQKIERLDLEGLPPSYFESASDILQEQRGAAKLRHRNDKINAELHDMVMHGKYKGCKVVTYKENNGKDIVYHIRGGEIAIRLVNQ